MSPWTRRWQQVALLFFFSGVVWPAAGAVDWTGFGAITDWFFEDCPESRPCQLLRRQLWRDSLYCNREPASVLQRQDPPRAAHQELRGTVAYAGFLTNPYRYTLIHEKSRTVVEVRVHLYRGWAPRQSRPLAAAEFVRMSRQLDLAAQLWTRTAPEGVHFRFRLMEDPEEAHFSVRAIDGPTRGPYHFLWSLNWSVQSVAHEVGHMMGLDDEYELLNPEQTDCPSTYLMCNNSGRPQPYYYYLILRRAACAQ